MAVEIVGSGLTFALSDTDGQPAPQNVAIPDGAEIALLFWHRFSFTPGAQLTGATIGGEAFTLLVNTVGTGSAGNYGCAWADVSELSGTVSAQWAWTDQWPDGGPTVSMVFVEGVDLEEPIRDSDFALGGSGSQSVTLTTQEDDLVVGMVAGSSATNAAPSGSGQTIVVANWENNGHEQSIGTEPGGSSSTTFSGTTQNPTTNIVAVALAAAAGAVNEAGGGAIAPAQTSTGSAVSLVEADGASAAPAQQSTGSATSVVHVGGSSIAPAQQSTGSATSVVHVGGSSIAPAQQNTGAATSVDHGIITLVGAGSRSGTTGASPSVNSIEGIQAGDLIIISISVKPSNPDRNPFPPVVSGFSR